MSNLSKADRLRAGLKKIVGEEALVNRERDMTLRDDKGKAVRDKVAEHTIGLLASKLDKCQKLEVGVSAFGKKAVVEVDPKNMLGLSRVDRAAAVAALNPELAAKDEVTSVNGKFTRQACGEIIADHIGALVGNDDIGNAMIVAAAVTGEYGRKLERTLLGPEEEKTPAPKKDRKPKVAESVEQSAPAPAAEVSPVSAS